MANRAGPMFIGSTTSGVRVCVAHISLQEAGAPPASSASSV
jgi:hypothetical protein